MTDLVCPRCGGSLSGVRFYGPCAACQQALRDGARLRHAVHRLIGFLTPGWGPPKEDPKVWAEMARRDREARETNRLRRARR